MAREAPPRRPGPVGRAAPPYASIGMMGSNQSGDLARTWPGSSAKPKLSASASGTRPQFASRYSRIAIVPARLSFESTDGLCPGGDDCHQEVDVVACFREPRHRKPLPLANPKLPYTLSAWRGSREDTCAAVLPNADHHAPRARFLAGPPTPPKRPVTAGAPRPDAQRKPAARRCPGSRRTLCARPQILREAGASP
jgi:hypothetical protein